ncbi:thiopeptide-type bacteriocin biosynthesis protein [Chryseobacterium sp. MEBOG06]|uniref:thiopeptide-type bacteriocin biosynthesis protein n=1 Tax=unclassified Chryseobacterium TaxID=2593645 RepID=UPI001F45937A|nr:MULTISPECIES: thiopeptide-type bacteriocin biosynthesis protein [unclassified Chryseobacterium]UKB84606.1 thiopeptide-type bacteriocin biosynthesis protein [Chryseobacterium sp. MEBOG06]
MKKITRKFIPGSKWLYIKLYTGIKTADIILEEAIKPLLELFKNESLTEKWFFIRYSDPDPHLRIRFEIPEPDKLGKAIVLIKNYLQEYIDSGEISKFIVDTYQREIERYGENTMEDAELLFWKSSVSILREYLHFDDEEKIIVSLFYIDRTLESLGVPISEKLRWIKEFNLAFKNEFNADKKLNSQLDKKYRKFAPKYSEFVNSNEFLYFRQDIIADVYDNEKIIQNILEHYSSSVQDFFQSIFHMHINRMFISNQRLFEMVIYDYLFRHYRKLAFKNNLKENK